MPVKKAKVEDVPTEEFTTLTLESSNGVKIEREHIYACKIHIIDDRYFVKVLVMTPTDFTGHGEWILLKGSFDALYDCQKFTQKLNVPLR